MRQTCPRPFLFAPRPAVRWFCWAVVLLAGGTHPVVGQPEDGELIRNGNFAAGSKHWNFSAEGKEAFAHRFEPVEEGAGQWAVIETKPDSSVGFSRISQALARVPDTPIKLSFRAAAEKPEGGNGAYAYVEFLNAGGRRISGLQSDFTPRSGDMKSLNNLAISGAFQF